MVGLHIGIESNLHKGLYRRLHTANRLTRWRTVQKVHTDVAVDVAVVRCSMAWCQEQHRHVRLHACFLTQVMYDINLTPALHTGYVDAVPKEYNEAVYTLMSIGFVMLFR